MQCYGSRKFCQRGSNFDNVFFFSLSLSLLIDGEGGSKYDYERAIIGTSAKRHECCPLVALWFLGDRDQYC